MSNSFTMNGCQNNPGMQLLSTDKKLIVIGNSFLKYAKIPENFEFFVNSEKTPSTTFELAVKVSYSSEVIILVKRWCLYHQGSVGGDYFLDFSDFEKEKAKDKVLSKPEKKALKELWFDEISPTDLTLFSDVSRETCYDVMLVSACNCKVPSQS